MGCNEIIIKFGAEITCKDHIMKKFILSFCLTAIFATFATMGNARSYVEPSDTVKVNPQILVAPSDTIAVEPQACSVSSDTDIVNPQTYVETFDTNSLGWTECSIYNNAGSAIIKNGVMTLKSKGIGKNESFVMSIILGHDTQVGENTSFETHCYAPIDVRKPFEVVANVRIKKLAADKACGFLCNYRDEGNYYSFTFNDRSFYFTRYENNVQVGSMTKAIGWPKKKKVSQQWKFISDGDEIRFYINGNEQMRLKYMPVDFSGIGFYAFGDQTLTVEDVTFIQLGQVPEKKFQELAY